MLVMFPVGFFIMFTEYGREYLWTTTIFLGLQAIIIFIILLYSADKISAVVITAIIFTTSYFIEWWGVNTGFPFGLYTYSGILKPLINGVPLAITFAWYVVAGSSLLAAKYMLKGSGAYAVIIVSSVFILATDILLEPFASFINGYWLWNSLAIPIQNFISWLLIGTVFSFTIMGLLKWNAESDIPRSIEKYPVIILFVNILNFSVVNIAAGYYVLTIIGISIFLIITVVSLVSKPKAA